MAATKSKANEIIALATLYDDANGVRGKIPRPVVRALKANDGDIVAFERLPNGAIVIRKSTAAERKALPSGRRRA